MTVRELLAKSDSKELTEWMIFLNMKAKESNPETAAPLDDRLKFGLKGYKRR